MWRVRRSVVPVVEGVVGEGRSMRRTEAPASARRRPAKGPGARPANSRTLRPVRGGSAGIFEVVVSERWIGVGGTDVVVTEKMMGGMVGG